MRKIRISYGDDESIMEWDGGNASAQIYVDGEPIGCQTADAQHSIDKAVELACGALWGRVYQTEAEANADGRDPRTSSIVIMDDVSWEEVDGDET